MDKFIPKITIKPNPKKKVRACPTPDLLNKVHLKREARKYWKKFPTNKNYETYTKYRNQVVWEQRKSSMTKEKRIATEAKTNPIFFQYSASKIKSKEQIANLKQDDGSLTNSNLQKAEVLNKFFKSVFTIEDNSTLPAFPSRTSKSISSIMISEEKMLKVLLSLNKSKSPGPDTIHPRILKELAHEISYPLTILFNTTMKHGQIPKDWKKAEVKPIFKKGDKSSPGNYRPVSLTSVVCKIFETFVRDALYEHLTSNDLLSPDQFGFCKGRSCVSQLLVTVNEWFQNIDKGLPVDTIYLDFAKAFDTVPHNRLLHKLKAYGISGKLLDWIQSFLTDRTQYVTVNGTSSGQVPVTSGVPQGSVLGPVLFIYFINDMPDILDGIKVKIFADDTKIFSPIASNVDNIKLQEGLDALTDWSND